MTKSGGDVCSMLCRIADVVVWGWESVVVCVGEVLWYSTRQVHQVVLRLEAHLPPIGGKSLLLYKNLMDAEDKSIAACEVIIFLHTHTHARTHKPGILNGCEMRIGSCASL